MAELHAELAFTLRRGTELRREAEHRVCSINVSKIARHNSKGSLGYGLPLSRNSLKLQSALNVKSSAPISLSLITAFRLFSNPTILP